MFTCETNGGDYTVWRVNGMRIADISPDIKEDLKFAHNGSEGTGNGLFIMNITARSIYNGTTVHCVTGHIEGMTVESEIVTMTIQGIHSWITVAVDSLSLYMNTWVNLSNKPQWNTCFCCC